MDGLKTNYFQNMSWRKAMINALDAKSKMGFLDGTLKKPEKSSPDYVRW